VGVVVIVAGVVVAGVLALRGGDDGPHVTGELTGTLVAETGEVAPITDVPEAYRVTYRTESEGSSGFTTGTQDLVVRRPFDATLTVHPDEGSTDDGDVVVTSRMGLYSYATASGDPQVQAGLPTVALGDVRFDGVLEDLVDAGLFVARERRAVLGRECQVYRTGQLVELVDVTAPTDDDYADVCIDATGLVLEQVMVQDGDAVTYEIATSVETDVTVTDDDFSITGEPLALDLGGNELVPLDATVAPAAGYWALPTPPDGYEHVGRYALRSLPSEDATTTTVGVVANETVETYVDVYRAGAAFVVVHQGDAALSPGRDTTVGTDVDAGALGSARVAYGLAGSTLVAGTDTWFVEITAPLSAADLGTLAAAFAPATTAP
jgi:hypothetical protein